ncbi:MAG: hypothetical protein KKD63_02880 [Proteobacteria bacterium]|nr:hypothetical protein [Desulfobulbaceae bacterium]MBU4151804.1 hypothetical protein [Pseudomonadota bacterium]MDP2105842.1 FlgO family outer membrane protein [Desulfobulbaceae bacterium]
MLGCSLNRVSVEEAPTETISSASEIAVAGANPAELFTSEIQQMAMVLFAYLEDPDPGAGDLADGIAVASFVDLNNLTRTSSFGRYLSEQLMTEFQQEGYRVVDVRKSLSITIQEKRGEYGLSRDMNEVSSTVRARTMITGTYTLAGNHILVNAKVLDSKTAVLLSSATMVFPRTKEVDLLLADSAVLTTASHQGMTLMKQLEL